MPTRHKRCVVRQSQPYLDNFGHLMGCVQTIAGFLVQLYAVRTHAVAMQIAVDYNQSSLSVEFELDVKWQTFALTVRARSSVTLLWSCTSECTIDMGAFCSAGNLALRNRGNGLLWRLKTIKLSMVSAELQFCFDLYQDTVSEHP